MQLASPASVAPTAITARTPGAQSAVDNTTRALSMETVHGSTRGASYSSRGNSSSVRGSSGGRDGPRGRGDRRTGIGIAGLGLV